MHIQPLSEHAGALALRAILDNILDLPRHRGDKRKVCQGEEQPRQVPAIGAGKLQHVAARRQIRDRRASREPVEQKDAGECSRQEVVEVAGQDGVALVAMAGLLEGTEKDVLVDGEPEGAGACHERRNDEELEGIVKTAGCHDGVDRWICGT